LLLLLLHKQLACILALKSPFMVSLAGKDLCSTLGKILNEEYFVLRYNKIFLYDWGTSIQRKKSLTLMGVVGL
jgi:hypothetical protein